jgi:hypothetical protein
MGDRRVDFERLAVVGSGRIHSGPSQIAIMRLASSINHVVLATENIARAIIAAAVCVVIYYAADREPPFSVVSVEPAAARPGEFVTIQARVERQVNRKCSAEFARYIFDAQGTRYDISTGTASAELVSRMERDTPGLLKVSVLVPPSASPGKAHLVTVLDYACNRTHRLAPIQVTTDMPFEVLPLP